MLDDLMQQLGAKDKKNYDLFTNDFNSKYLKQPLNNFMYGIHAMTKATEIAPRTAYLDWIQRWEKQNGVEINKKVVDLEISSVVTPFYAARGYAAPYMELIWPFYAAQLNAMRTEKKSFRRDPYVYIARAIYNNPWEVIAALITAGFLTDIASKWFNDIEPEICATHHCFPAIEFGDWMPGTNTPRYQLNITIKKDHMQMAHAEILRSSIFAFLNLIGWEGGPSDGEYAKMTSRRRDAILKTLGVSPPILNDVIVGGLEYLAFGTMPKSSFTGRSNVSERTQFLSSNATDLSGRLEYFNQFRNQWINNIGILSLVGWDLPVDEAQQITNKEDALTTVFNKLLLPGKILKSTFNVSDRLEKTFRDSTYETKHSEEKFKYDTFQLINTKDFDEMTAEEMIQIEFFMHQFPDSARKAFVINGGNGSPAISKVEYRIMQLSPARKMALLQILKDKYDLKGRIKEKERDALQKGRNDAAHINKNRQKKYNLQERLRYGVDEDGIPVK